VPQEGFEPPTPSLRMIVRLNRRYLVIPRQTGDKFPHLCSAYNLEKIWKTRGLKKDAP
jgi:hypothetical protein